MISCSITTGGDMFVDFLAGVNVESMGDEFSVLLDTSNKGRDVSWGELIREQSCCEAALAAALAALDIDGSLSFHFHPSPRMVL
jgi:hypothetical protein